MAPPTTPYSTPTQAAYLLQTMFRGVVPNAGTSVTDTVFDQLISWTDAVIDGDFRSVGYKIPFVVVTGETWHVSQTTLLSFISALGAAAMAGGHILNPAPAMMPIRSGGGDQHPYALAIDKTRLKIREDGFRLRANFYLGTKAEKWLSEPRGPWTDFMVDYYDPTRYQMVREYTEMMAGVFTDIGDLSINWDYLWTLKGGKFNAT